MVMEFSEFDSSLQAPRVVQRSCLSHGGPSTAVFGASHRAKETTSSIDQSHFGGQSYLLDIPRP